MRAVAATALVLLLSGCTGSGADPDETATTEAAAEETPAPMTTLTANEGTLTIDVPEGWSQTDQDLSGSVAIAAEGPDPLDQLVVTTFDSLDDAQAQAEATADGLASDDIECDQSELESQTVIDCAQDVDGETVRRLLFPTGGDSHGAVVLVQTSSPTLEEAGEVALPMVESLTF